MRNQLVRFNYSFQFSMMFAIFHIAKIYSFVFMMIISCADDLFSLDNYTWKNRVVLLFGDEKAEKKINRQLDILLKDGEGLQDRDLKIFRILDKSVLEIQENKSMTKPMEIYQYHQTDEFQVILIGKDGTIKYRSHKPVSKEKLYSTIDSMPMRKAEMKE